MEARRAACRQKHLWLTGVLWALLLGLAARVLASVPSGEVVRVLRAVDLRLLGLIAAADVAMVAAAPVRLWLLARVEGRRLPWAPLVFYRLASSALNYVSPTRYVGGEAVQVLLLHRRHKLSMADAAALTALERMAETAAAFALLPPGLLLAAAGSRGGSGGALAPLLIASLLAAAALPAYGLALRAGRRPVTAAFRRLPGLRGRPLAGIGGAEESLAGLWARRPGAITAAFALSWLLWVPIALEYHLILLAVGAPAGLRESVQGLLLARAALLAPIPGALGVLEAGQVAGVTRLGASAAIGLSAGLLMRARDLLFVLPGLAALFLLRRRR